MNSDFKDLLVILHQEDVRYLIVGGYAVIHYSQPRYTKDPDIWVKPNRENAEKRFRAFHRFGISTFGLEPADFEIDGTQLNVGVVPVAIDFLTSLPGVDFDHAWPRREESESEGIPINSLSKADLIVAKNVAGRLQDLADIEEMKRLDE